MPTQLDRDLYCLRQAGFAIVPDFFESAQLDRLQLLAEQFRQEILDYEAEGGKVIFKAGWPLQNVRCLYAVAPEFGELISNERMLQYPRNYLDNPTLADCTWLTNMPDERNQLRGREAGVNYHRDGMWPEGEIKPTYLHCFVLLTDMTKDNGGTVVVPGTHREREPGYYFKDNDPGQKVEGNYYPVYPRSYFPASIQVEARRGSLVLIDPMTVHSQGVNTTPNPRTVISCGFVAAGGQGFINSAGVGRHARYPIPPAVSALLHQNEELPSSYGPLGGPQHAVQL